MMGSATAPAVGLRERDHVLTAGDHWWRPAAAVDHHVLSRAVGPVLDVGCGPGRHVVALAERGVPALGIDVTAAALTAARERGVLVLERSVFDRVPGAGRWATALLLDGNVGIGGRPVPLLRRVGALLRPGGRVIVEVGGPGTAAPVRTVRLEVGTACGPWFRWAHVATDELPALAARAAMTVQECWAVGARWFAVLAARVGSDR
jgi:SAM-dependent methyltransferase